MRYSLLLLCAARLLLGQGSPDVVISQVYGGGGNTGAPLRNDFIELFNRGRAVVNLTGWSVQYASATGELWQATPLNGSIQPGGYYLVQQAEGANTALPGLPSPDATGTIAMSAASAKIALSRSTTQLSGTRPAGVVDLVGYGAANGFEGSGAARLLTNSTAAARRGGGCTDADDNANDFQTVTPEPRNSLSPVVDCTVTPQPPVSLRISDIQGAGEISPYAGRAVTTRGVVTGRARDGFWIQSGASEEDDDPETSEGLWVYFAMSPPGTTERGYVVQVTGIVNEYRPPSDRGSAPRTELVDPSYELIAQGQALPAPVTLQPGIDWERYENMLVEAAAVTAVSPTVSDAFYATLPGQVRPYHSPSATDEPERFRVDMRKQSPPVLNVTSPTAVTGLSGVLDYAFRTWSVAQNTGALLTAADMRRAQPVPPPGSREFHVASMNLQRFSGEPLKNAKTATVIRGLLRSPEIVAVQEVENLDVLRALARETGDYEAHLLEGNDIGGIDVGFLTRRDRVRVETVVQEGRDQSYQGGRLWERPPLVARLQVAGVPLTAIVVHLRSLINADDSAVAARRRAQAEFLRDLAAARIRAGEAVVMLGDFNMSQYDELMAVIRSAGLTNLADLLPPPESYSYIQNGATQTLDHILIAEALRPHFVRATYARVNADYPESFGASAQFPERVSDHDVPVAYFDTDPAAIQVAPAGVTNSATFLSGPVAPLEIVTIFGRGFSPESRVLFDNVEAQVIYADASQVSAVVPAGVQSRSVTVIQVETAGRRSPPVEVPVAEASPGIFVISRANGRNQAAVLNQDNSVNGPGSPANRGSVIQIFGTGQGTGGLPTAVRIGGRSARILYSGQAPGLVPGAWQVNAVVPDDVTAGDAEIILASGDKITPLGVMVALR